jgi:hypothetical protein
MAFGTNSKIFRAGLADSLGNVTAIDLDADTFRAALYGNTGTPDQDATAANSAYNVSAWATANEVYQAGQWAQAGVALTGVSLDRATAGVVFFDATDTASGAAATLAAVYGCLVYDDTLTTPVADQGICYNAFGGSQSVTAGSFTIIWNANGVMRYTL